MDLKGHYLQDVTDCRNLVKSSASIHSPTTEESRM